MIFCGYNLKTLYQALLKKLLLISYYWPPAGGGGVQRWLKMSKYLPENGWTPIVYTAQPENFVAEDQSLVDEIHPDIQIIRTPIFEPYGIYAKFTGQKKGSSNYSGFIDNKKPSLTKKISLFIRSNFFIPDARKFWIRPSIKYLSKWLKENPVDAIVSTGPPHSMHVIALALKKKYPNIPWVADFRDPWTNIDFYKDLKMMPFADRKHRRLEKQVLQAADEIVTVTWSWSEEFKDLSGGRAIKTILNGFDPKDFENFQTEKSSKFIICHLGSMNKDRNPINLWKAIKLVLDKNPNFKNQLEIHLIGPVDHTIRQNLATHGLEDYTTFQNFIPHKEAIQFLQKCQLLLLPINDTPNSQGILPGKLYEYLATKIPILSLGPLTGDIGKVLNEMDYCALKAYDDLEGIENFICEVWKNPKEAALNINKYSRRTHAKDYSQLLNDLIQTKNIS